MPLVCKAEFKKHELLRETAEMKRHFNHFIAEIQQHMLALQHDGILDTSVIINCIIMYDRKLKTCMSHCTSLQDVVETASSPEHSSFLDYDLIKLLIDYGSDTIKSAFTDYKKKLQNFLKDRTVKLSSQKGRESHYAVVIDESIVNDNPNLIQLHNRVKNILGDKNIELVHWKNLNMESQVNEEASNNVDETSSGNRSPDDLKDGCGVYDNTSTKEETSPLSSGKEISSSEKSEAAKSQIKKMAGATYQKASATTAVMSNEALISREETSISLTTSQLSSSLLPETSSIGKCFILHGEPLILLLFDSFG